MSLESELKSLIFQITFLLDDEDEAKAMMPKVTSLFIQSVSLIRSMDLELQPKPDSKFISLIKQVISFGSSISNSEPEWEIISQMISLVSCIDSNSDPKQEQEPELVSLVTKIYNHYNSLESGSELGSLIYDILVLSRFGCLCSLISLSPQVEVTTENEKICMIRKLQGEDESEGDESEGESKGESEESEGESKGESEGKSEDEEEMDCEVGNMHIFRLTGEVPTHFNCSNCNGEKHKESDKAPIEVKHPLHPKHSLQLVMSKDYLITRKCYCCDENLREVFYYCSACDYAMNIVCAEKPLVLSVDYPKWHEHALAPVSRHTSLTCDVCALTHSRCLFYICPPCGFVVHQSCLQLPRVIKISRHSHRISFTTSFDHGDRSCGVCRRKIDNDYGGYSCSKKDCLYAVHSRCATQSNIWDGIELEEVPKETEEEVIEPFVRIRDGIIQHFSHQQHHMRLDGNMDRDYDENRQCQACITPIYSGNIYSCTLCNFILHEKCANLSRKLHHPIHPHILTLVGAYDGFMDFYKNRCSACFLVCTNGFFYECSKEECGGFKLHVQCATISEPLIHESHMHPLFLTSKPGEQRACRVCEGKRRETFNCIEECNFALCFECATLPYKVRYKHDKHMLTLTYGDEKSTMEYWCEGCETKINPKKRFYWCDDGCCVTIHIECLIGKELYMKPNSYFVIRDKVLAVLPNRHHMSRPFCLYCWKRCPHNTAFYYSGSITCCVLCTVMYHKSL